METVVLALAFVGAAALLTRLAGTGVRAALRSAEAAAAEGRVEISAWRGDLTGMAEGRAVREAARRSRRDALLLGLLWLGWLSLPLFAGLTREAYAIAATLWLLPTPALRLPRAPGDR